MEPKAMPPAGLWHCSAQESDGPGLKSPWQVSAARITWQMAVHFSCSLGNCISLPWNNIKMDYTGGESIRQEEEEDGGIKQAIKTNKNLKTVVRVFLARCRAVFLCHLSWRGFLAWLAVSWREFYEAIHSIPFAVDHPGPIISSRA